MEDEVYKFLRSTIGRAMENKIFRNSIKRQIGNRRPQDLTSDELLRIVANAIEETKGELG